MKRQSISDHHQDTLEQRSKAVKVRRGSDQVQYATQNSTLQEPADANSDGSSSRHSHTNDMTSGEKLWEEIEDEIERSLVVSTFEKTSDIEFLPEGALDNILSKFSKREQHAGGLRQLMTRLILPRAFPIYDHERSLINYIIDEKKPAIKLLFTVLYMKHEDPYGAMALLEQNSFRDENLPIQWSNSMLKSELNNHPFTQMFGTSDKLWSRRVIKEFHQKQRIFQAPVLTKDPKELRFGHQHVIPFIASDTKISPSKGASGVVFKYTIHPNHFVREENAEEPCVVAVKELRKGKDGNASHWANEIAAMSKMNSLRQDNIVRFLTAFTQSKPGGKPDDLEYYMIFEWADGGNLKDLWKHCPVPDRNAAFLKWVIKQLHGISQALHAAHYLLDNDGQYRGGSYRHGDLKPENILWFRKGESWGTLKICDWGEAKIHNKVTALRHGTNTEFGTRRYEPPEVIERGSNYAKAANHSRSRLYDLWSMGCVIMECMIWLVYGLDELSRFNQENHGKWGFSEHFYERKPAGNTVRMVVHGTVKRWLKHMMNDPFCRPGESAIGDALEIVKEGLLVVQLPKEEDVSTSSVLWKHPVTLTSPPQSISDMSSSVEERYVGTSASSNVQQYSEEEQTPSLNPETDQSGTGDLSFTMNLRRATVEFHTPEAVTSKPGGPVRYRYRAPELSGCLREIVEHNSNDDNYWQLLGKPALVPPRYSTDKTGNLQLPDSHV